MMRTFTFRAGLRWIALLPMLCCFTMLSAQSLTIRGTVTDPGGEPLIGVTVRVVNSPTRGTVTDATGAYSLQASPGERLNFVYTGYLDQTVTVPADGSAVNLLLSPNPEVLDEVVVVGYGTQKKSDLTGAVSSVSSEQLKNSVVTNLDQALQGRIAGVQVTQNSGQPGGATSIRIRGANSITGSSEPLYVIDGIPFQGDGTAVSGFDWAGGANGQNRVNPLSAINPNDIVSIEVLKDASSSAIYGARAANGVILITTKRGKKGESRISYNGYYGNQSLGRKLDMMNLQQYADYQLQISKDLGLQPNQRYLDPSLLGSGTDWQNEIFRNAGMQSHQLSVSGGNDKTTYAISGGFFNQDGIVIGSDFERYSARINLDNQVKDWFKIGGSLAYATTNEKITLNDGGDGVIMQALLTQPDISVRDIDGNYAGPETQYTSASYNPVAAALQRNNTLARQRLMGNVYGDIALFKNLTFRSEIGFDDNHGLNKAFHPTYRWGVLVNTENQLRQREETSFFWVWKNYLTYQVLDNETHKLTAMVGQEAQKSTWQGSQVTKKNFSSNDIPVLSEGEDITSRTFGWKDAASIASYFGRFNYSLFDRYLVTFTMRADGSSKFGPENRWGYFPSAAIAWRLGDEAFMNSLNTNLKLRLGYGEVGNQAIANYLYGASLLAINSPFGTAYRLEKISNPKLKWEATKQFNAGVDISLVKGRIDLSLDVYNKQTTDMLLQLSVPSYLGGTGWQDIRAPFGNVGKMENKGFDLSLHTHNIEKAKFKWGTDITFSRNRNKVKELDDANRIYWRNLYWYSEFQTATKTQAGQPLGQFYGYQTEGLFTSKEDILAHALQVNDPNNDGENLVDKRAGIWIGDIKFKDLNGDGVINTDDQTIIGNPNPDFTFGFNNSFTYGPLDLVVYFTGSYGADILNYSRVQIEGMTNVYANQAATVFDRAQYNLIDPNGSDLDPANVTLANPGTDIPRPTTTDNNGNTRMSDRFIEDGSYLRLQNVRLAYMLPVKFTKKYRVERLKLYVNAQNLYTFTKYTGYDPEIGAFNQDPLLQNVDMGRYPTPRVYTFGVDVDF
ncbi:MAG TPA: TonB-dependent receptor [Saprospiraceae bacterium]|nr:TonB-dependent receptor [Saprospiraceae bacterium]HPI05220.1 TonB-dependent receptor [Saprospiraceae bacterium]